MKIFKIEVENFRLLKDFSIDLEDELSLVIGKNNTGKTSLLIILEKFLNQSERNKFYFDDFNIEFKKELKKIIEQTEDISEDSYKEIGIRLKLLIEYNESDNLANINRVMMDLDPANNIVVLGFEYILKYEEYKKLINDYKEFKGKEKNKNVLNVSYKPKELFDFLKHNHSKYFKFNKKSFQYDIQNKKIIETIYIDLIAEEISIKDILSYKYISAKREVANKDFDKTLSGQTSKIYEKTESNEARAKAVEDFKDKLSETDDNLTEIYSTLFEEIVKKVRTFGGIKLNDSEIDIISTLQHQELLKGNTTVIYKHDDNTQLPEYFNGLGYMNLISMIFEIEILVQEFKGDKDKKPADINLLFIEEPEAHTHPQMQYVFIKNIKTLLKEGIKREDGENRKLQYVISTHSSHITADSDFNDIKYLKRENDNSVIAKNLKDLEKEYIDNGEILNFRFLKQYLTLNRAELFFADKAIFIEGDTERILLPAMMKKIDCDIPENPLLSQNISIIEVGNYSNIFEKFIGFIGIKSLIITDIDSVKKEPVKNSDGSIKKTKRDKEKKAYSCCCVADGEKSSNPSLLFFFKDKTFNELIDLSFENKRFSKGKTWSLDPDGLLQICYQTKENGYHARSFEDSFFNLKKNIGLIKTNRNKIEGLKNIHFFYDKAKDPYELAERCIDSKGTFAIDVLICSSENNFQNWDTPDYIKEGLLWLKKD